MLVFDFDGVLLDSHAETKLTAFNAAAGTLHVTLEDLPEAYHTFFDKNRSKARNAGEMLTLARLWIEMQCSDLTPEEFQTAIASVGDGLHDRSRIFFESRFALKELNNEAWVRVSKPIQPIWDAVAGLSADQLIILTHKNRDAVIEITRYYGMDQLMEENLYSGDSGESKEQHLVEILKRFSQRPLRFFDDAIRNLLDIKEVHSDRDEVMLYLTDWGYLCAKEDLKRAIDEGIEVISQEGVIEYIRALN